MHVFNPLADLPRVATYPRNILVIANMLRYILYTNTSDRIAKIRNRHIIIHFGPKIDLRQLHLEDFLLACNDALALVAHDCRTTADLTEALPGSSHGFPQVAEWIETAVLKLPFPKHKTTAKGKDTSI